MRSSVEDAALFLFVPGDRPDRFAKAFAAGADAVILDLEDAVAPGAKGAARDALVEADAAHAAALGFSGKLLIHPQQIAPAARGFAPGAEEIAWAGRVVEAGQGGGAVSLDGEMVDAPVILRARRVLAAAARSGQGATA